MFVFYAFVAILLASIFAVYAATESSCRHAWALQGARASPGGAYRNTSIETWEPGRAPAVVRVAALASFVLSLFAFLPSIGGCAGLVIGVYSFVTWQPLGIVAGCGAFAFSFGWLQIERATWRLASKLLERRAEPPNTGYIVASGGAHLVGAVVLALLTNSSLVVVGPALALIAAHPFLVVRAAKAAAPITRTD